MTCHLVVERLVVSRPRKGFFFFVLSGCPCETLGPDPKIDELRTDSFVAADYVKVGIWVSARSWRGRAFVELPFLTAKGLCAFGTDELGVYRGDQPFCLKPPRFSGARTEVCERLVSGYFLCCWLIPLEGSS